MRNSFRGAAGGVLLLVVAACSGGGSSVAPDVPADLARGRELYGATCAACHGQVGEGATTGPPLVHELYEPGHHSDESFQRAAAIGVQPHHWDFGPMPAVGATNGLTRDDVADIIAYVRDLQREAGIG